MYQSHRALLGDRLWTALLHLAPERPREARSLLLRQGDPATHVLVLCSGSVAVTRRDGRGQRTLLAVRGAGELLGELSLLDGGVRSATVIAAGPCRVHTVPAPDFEAFVSEHRLMHALTRHAVGRIRESEEIRQELATAPAPARLAAALLRLAEASGQPAVLPVHIGLTQEELAQLIGTSRNSVVHSLSPWRAEGWIRAAPGGGLVLEHLDGLRRVVGPR
ncbi:Crp/Fnr family transcriptional regulator [Streptomyces syringium]|uniref:Crp/Fnr family transcriptional regulator n=1 Tax=Streptomyces syringium TaxID=76729 RepID=UPI001AE9A537|nr:Crp/Fnr family transcriptional regulator [Streptomyces syringium]